MRKYPIQYSPEVQMILSTMSLGEPSVVGSSADNRILYSADYDMLQNVKLSSQSARSFVHHIANLTNLPNTHILDIKIGEIPQWNLLRTPTIENEEVVDYNRKQELDHLSFLRDQKVITESEYKNAKKLLPIHMSPIKFLEARKELRFGLLRWTPSNVMKGYLKLRDGNVISLYDAFKTSGVTKVDVISWVNNKYNEFSNIILWDGYSEVPNAEYSIKENILLYLNEKNYLKALKRIFSLSKLKKDKAVEEKAIAILNSEIGYLYSIVADLETMELLKQTKLTKLEKKNLQYEMGTLRDKIAKAYFDGNKRAKRASFSLLPKLSSILQNETRKVMMSALLLPIADSYLP